MSAVMTPETPKIETVSARAPAPARSPAPAETPFAEPRQCTGTRRDGALCGAFVTAGSGYRYCWTHDPHVSPDVRAAASAKGGALIALRSRTRWKDAANPDLSSPVAVQAFLQEIGGMVLRGELASRSASALIGVANAALAAHRENLSARLDELELEFSKRARPIEPELLSAPHVVSPAPGATLARRLASQARS